MLKSFCDSQSYNLIKINNYSKFDFREKVVIKNSSNFGFLDRDHLITAITSFSMWIRFTAIGSVAKISTGGCNSLRPSSSSRQWTIVSSHSPSISQTRIFQVIPPSGY